MNRPIERLNSDYSVDAALKADRLLDMMARDEAIAVIAQETGASSNAIKFIRRLVELSVQKHGYSLEDLTSLATLGIQGSGSVLVPVGQISHKALDEVLDAAALSSARGSDGKGESDNASTLLKRIREGVSPDDLRSLARVLIELAAAFDSTWAALHGRPKSYWDSEICQIEQTAPELAKAAILGRKASAQRAQFLPREFFGEPAWEMLTELFIQFSAGEKVSTKALTIVSGVPETTALRIIERLEAAKLIQKVPSAVDRRVTYIELTRPGLIAVGSALRAMRAKQGSAGSIACSC
jgi:hypothetical protein